MALQSRFSRLASASRRALSRAGDSSSVRAGVELQRLVLEEKKLELAFEEKKLAQEAMKLAQAGALEEKKLAQAGAFEEKKLAQEAMKLAQSRGLLEVVFGVSRESAQMVSLVAAGVVFVASGAYLTSGMVHETRANLSVVAAEARNASADVRSLVAGRGTPAAAELTPGLC